MKTNAERGEREREIERGREGWWRKNFYYH